MKIDEKGKLFLFSSCICTKSKYMLQATQLNCKFSNNAMQSLGHHRQIRGNQKSPRCRFGGDERWKQIWGFHKIATYFVAENAQKCVKGDRGSGNNLFFSLKHYKFISEQYLRSKVYLLRMPLFNHGKDGIWFRHNL